MSKFLKRGGVTLSILAAKTKPGTQETLGGVGYVCHLDRRDGITGVRTCPDASDVYI